MGMHIAKVIKDFGEAIDKKTNKPKYGMRPRLNAKIRLSTHDYDMVKADGLIEDVQSEAVKKK